MERFGYRRVGENRYREDKGFCYEDFVLGMVIEHRPGRTVTVTVRPGRCSMTIPSTKSS